MTTYISLLRGINVGGRRKILMADLKKLYETLGYTDIITYIQSGNVIFTSQQSPGNIVKNIEQNISDTYGFDVPVVLRTGAEIENIFTINPFLENDLKKLYVTFLSEIPKKEEREKIEKCNRGEDTFQVIGKNIFLLCEGKYHTSKFTNNFFEKKLGVKATTRNRKTVNKLYELRK